MRTKVLALITATLLLARPALAEVPLDPDSTATIRLSPQGYLVYPVTPPLPHAPANYGAILSVDIDEPGLYHVSLGAPGWIDMFRGGKALDPVGNRRPGLATILDFILVPGHYKLALSGMAAGEVSVAISR